MRRILTFILLLTSATAAVAAKPIVRSLNTMGFRGKITITLLPDDRVAIEARTARDVTTDTVRGHSIYPLYVHGRAQSFYFGRFGASRFPMLILGVTDPDRIQDSRVLAYQVSPIGTLIGQQVIVDDALRHGHTDDVSGGKFALGAVDPSLGALYSISYQDARFEGYFASYEKLRVRQWDPILNGFIESDQGFLRDRDGRIVESSKFYGMGDRVRGQMFLSNLRGLSYARYAPRAASRVVPVASTR